MPTLSVIKTILDIKAKSHYKKSNMNKANEFRSKTDTRHTETTCNHYAEQTENDFERQGN